MTDIETEVKFNLSDPGAYLARVLAMGGQLVQPRTYERNIRFDLPDHSLSIAGRVLRLRQDAEVHLTYKDSGHLVDGVLTRREIEFKADDFDIAKRFLEALDYQEYASYEKYRQVYKMDDLLVTLDELPYGTFTEIEGEPASMIQSVATTLRLDWSKRINFSYLVMFEIMKKNLNFKGNALSFEALAGLSITPQDLGVSPADMEA
jgi:adenylate cyclase class 2